jgi:hypothetical protein
MTTKSIEEIEQGELLLESIRRQLFGIPAYPSKIRGLEEVPLYYGAWTDEKTDDPQVGMIKNIKVLNEDGFTKIKGDLIIDDSEKGKKVKAMINKRTPMYIPEEGNDD